MRRELAFTGGALLTAGVLLGFIVDRFARPGGSAAAIRPDPTPLRADLRGTQPVPSESLPVTDVLESFRAAGVL